MNILTDLRTIGCRISAVARTAWKIRRTAVQLNVRVLFIVEHNRKKNTIANLLSDRISQVWYNFQVSLRNSEKRLLVNPLTPNDPCSGRTAPLTSKRCILYIYSTNICTEYFKHGIYTYSPFLSLQNAVCFILLAYLVPVLFTFYIQVC